MSFKQFLDEETEADRVVQKFVEYAKHYGGILREDGTTYNEQLDGDDVIRFKLVQTQEDVVRYGKTLSVTKTNFVSVGNKEDKYGRTSYSSEEMLQKWLGPKKKEAVTGAETLKLPDFIFVASSILYPDPGMKPGYVNSLKCDDNGVRIQGQPDKTYVFNPRTKKFDSFNGKPDSLGIVAYSIPDMRVAAGENEKARGKNKPPKTSIKSGDPYSKNIKQTNQPDLYQSDVYRPENDIEDTSGSSSYADHSNDQNNDNSQINTDRSIDPKDDYSGDNDDPDIGSTKNQDWKNAENNAAKQVDNWINRKTKEPNPNIDQVVPNDVDEFYAVRPDLGANASDVLVVHDKPDQDGQFNKDKSHPDKTDKTFFVEVKKSIDSMSFNPTLEIRQEGNRFRYDYKPIKDSGKLPSRDKSPGDTYDCEQIMSQEDLGDVLTECLNNTQQDLLKTLFRIINAYKKILQIKNGGILSEEQENQINNVVLPRDSSIFASIFDAIIDYSIQPKNEDGWKEFNDILQENEIDASRLCSIYREKSVSISRKKSSEIPDNYNVSELKNLNDTAKGLMLFFIFGNKLRIVSTTIGSFPGSQNSQNNPGLLKKIAWAIMSWYKDHKKAAYMTIGRDEEKNHKGGFYIFDPKLDPLGILQKFPETQSFMQALKGVRLTVNRNSINSVQNSNKQTRFFIQAELNLDDNGNTIETIMGDIGQMKNGDDKNDKTQFFKENDNTIIQEDNIVKANKNYRYFITQLKTNDENSGKYLVFSVEYGDHPTKKDFLLKQPFLVSSENTEIFKTDEIDLKKLKDILNQSQRIYVKQLNDQDGSILKGIYNSYRKCLIKYRNRGKSKNDIQFYSTLKKYSQFSDSDKMIRVDENTKQIQIIDSNTIDNDNYSWKNVRPISQNDNLEEIRKDTDAKFTAIRSNQFREDEVDTEQFDEDVDTEFQGKFVSEDDQDNQQPSEYKNWELQEINVSDGLNNVFNTLNTQHDSDSDIGSKEEIQYRLYSCCQGGGDKGDTLVVYDHADKNGKFNDGKDSYEAIENGGNGKSQVDQSLYDLKPEDKYFYIESKLNSNSGQYLKFSLDAEVNSDNTISVSYNNIWKTENSLSSLQTILNTIPQNIDSDLKKTFIKIKNFMNRCSQMNSLPDDIKSQLNSKTLHFPKDFDTLSQVFNYYFLQWTKKYLIFKLGYIEGKLTNNQKQCNECLQESKFIQKKLKQFSNNIEGIKDMTFCEKTKRLLAIFGIIKDPEDPNKFITYENINLDDLVSTICNYYKNTLKSYYIVIGKEIYKLGQENPLGLNNVQDFTSSMSNPIVSIDIRNRESGNVYLFLNIHLSGRSDIKYDKPISVKEAQQLFSGINHDIIRKHLTEWLDASTYNKGK